MDDLAVQTYKVQEIISRWGPKPDLVIEMLHDIQTEFKYLPEQALNQICREVGVRLATLYHIATFYNAFSLTPRGKHQICVCMGTPCHALGAPRIVEAIERHLKVKCGGTTEDLKFTLEVSGCVGTCGLAPIVIVDGELHGLVTPVNVSKVIDRYSD
ncbi:MAG: NAD(P)H-dependent oxidoreductase subunit E [Calditrichaeota bacterium]|nr:NAD(P)H-dependent oxidoreductase subunit E [Calditrichota bacterium]